MRAQASPSNICLAEVVPWLEEADDCSWLQIPREISRKLMKLAAAVLTGDSVLNSVLTAVNRVLKVYCTTGVAP